MLAHVARYALLLTLAACAPDLSDTDALDTDASAPVGPTSGGEGVLPDYTLLPANAAYRSVGFSAPGPSTAGLSSSTEVWRVTREWDDVEPEKGLAWGERSGLDWDAKYAAWVDSLEATTAVDGHTTVMVTTPWGRTLPAPRLECAEMAMFLRVSFAAWHGLPFFMTAYSPGVGRVHYGHFGQVDDGGRRLSGSPAYGTAYRDYTASHGGLDPAAIETWWPDDTALEARSLTLAEDDRVEFLGADAFAGAYFDEVHLNKRVGHFLIRLLPSFGSIHFADAANLFNLVPGDLREGDVLLHRWQAQGIGHVMVVKEVEALPGGNLDAEIVFGSMPRIQPKWYTAAYSKSYFTSPYSGGPETTSDGTAYSRLGGGIKRWRTPVRDSGRWSNLVPVADRDAWIGSTDWPALEARPETFRGLLGNLSPSEQRDVLVDRIEGARANLRQRPASCANRQRREEAFDELYALMNREWGWSRTRVDETYRHVEDYVYAELEYSQSRTCCWNRTTPEMHGIIAEYTDQLVGTAHEAGECVEPVVFRMRGGGYDPFRAYAHQTGRGGLWAEWSEDEDCPQRANLDDVESNAPWSEFCDVADALLGGDDGGGDDGGGTTGGGSGGSGSGPTCSGCSGQRPVVPWAPLVLGGVLLGRRRRR